MRVLDGSVTDKVVLLRGDCNAPLEGNIIMDDSRLTTLLPTIELLLRQNNKVILASHLGRPKGYDPSLSMSLVASFYKAALPTTTVSFCPNLDQVLTILNSSDYGKTLVILENLRFLPGEEDNDPALGRALASLAEVYVNDAFACSHRAHASISSVPLPSYMGLLMQKELASADSLLNAKERPSTVIVGGAKISTKATLITNLSNITDHVVVGGGVANYLLDLLGYNIGRSLVEKSFTLEQALDFNKIIIPEDLVVTRDGQNYLEVPVDSVENDDMIVDIGSATIERITRILRMSRVVVWNGPLGWFERKPFDKGSAAIAKEIANLTANMRLRSIIGGGDTIRLIRELSLLDAFSHVSTGGGALLDLLSGNELPGLTALYDRGI